MRCKGCGKEITAGEKMLYLDHCEDCHRKEAQRKVSRRNS